MVVYIVGAGPGDPSLLTLKAKSLIESAEVIIYDKLVNEEILGWANPKSELIYVGKRERDSKKSGEIQERINQLLSELGPNKMVVRLKGGDPFIFGRGGEEAQVCAQNNIPFEIVPGISSAFAVPAYSGVPVSHRDFNSSFAVLTGHEADKEGTMIDWKHLPENIIVLMGVSQIKKSAANLITSGRDPATPVAAIHSGTTPKQRTEITDLKTLAEEGIGLSAPVIFVIGPVVNLHNELSWFEKKLDKIRGKKAVLTGAKSHEEVTKDLMNYYGMDTISMPLIEIIDKEFSLPDINEFDALVFTSQEGIKRVEDKIDLLSFKGNVYAIGPKTKVMLKKWNVNATMGASFNSQGLSEHILNTQKKESKILALRSSKATDVLRENLKKDYDYTEIPIYDIKRRAADFEKIKEGDVIFVMSASCAKSLSELPKDELKGRTYVSIGPETSKYLTVPHIESNVHTIRGMIDSYMDYLWRESK
jgi:uroporphyrinogen III methyltransferase/synthase